MYIRDVEEKIPVNRTPRTRFIRLVQTELLDRTVYFFSYNSFQRPQSVKILGMPREHSSFFNSKLLGFLNLVTFRK